MEITARAVCALRLWLIVLRNFLEKRTSRTVAAIEDKKSEQTAEILKEVFEN